MASRNVIRKRWRNPIAVFAVGIFVVGLLSFTQPSPGGCSHRKTKLDPKIMKDTYRFGYHSRMTLSTVEGSPNDTKPPPQFPPDFFTETQRKHGAVIFHVIGLLYMFVALAIVCDEFFIPALDVITEKLKISEDVAGATFMAAGGSAPELFTSVIGAFISFDDVGIGTIVGSAVFNILFVISMCAIFSKSVLQLTWWPLFRDVSFYSVILIILIICFQDNIIYWYEAVILILSYACYVTFMKFNEQIERFVKKVMNRNKMKKVGSADHIMQNRIKRRMSAPILHAGSKFRQGVLQLMIHSIDPLHEGRLDENASQLHAIASLRVLLDATKSNSSELQNGAVVAHIAPPTGKYCSVCSNCETSAKCVCKEVKSISNAVASAHVHNNVTTLDIKTAPSDGNTENEESQIKAVQINKKDTKVNSLTPITDNSVNDPGQTNSTSKNAEDKNYHQKEMAENVDTADPGHSPSVEPSAAPTDSQMTIPKQEEHTDIPLDMSWPDTWQKRLNYVLLAPIIIPLWLTLPDVRKEEKRRWFAGSFIGSILWIAFFSYLMVWWASLTGETAGIPNEVMGLTFLAAGTSIPDLITSVLVARKGFGDMAVSSSVGSNIFDVAIGLPLPWFLATMIFGPVQVSSSGMACSIFLLFCMLLFVIVSIACFKWKMNTSLAGVMLFLYFVFIAISLLLEYNVISCTAILKSITG
ncbi:sodium/potassium/calcium exchanger 2-like isoform X2 [Limulus polyphemus]|uniref:Sodium/potassium/calcium exchanger 2-like isoform X2 n=1 Tax=Limulus polyphemus TaxID=6850 RepID=A0ABM1T964_LIMPO|nr:sodium/potassium/calcium exchanger 2-like isoform X2 [Limulus polyphemus]